MMELVPSLPRFRVTDLISDNATQLGMQDANCIWHPNKEDINGIQSVYKNQNVTIQKH